MQPIPWLPANCLSSKRAAEPFEQIIDGWAEEWLVGEKWRVLGSWDDGGTPRVGSWSTLRETPKLQIKGKAKAVQSLGEAMLGVDAKNPRTEADLKLMRKIAAQALDDLQLRIDRELGAGSSATVLGSSGENPGRQFSLLIGVVGQARLALECAEADLVRLVRKTFPARAPKHQLENPRSSCLTQPIGVAGRLGSATIELREIADLSIGDLILLDSKTQDSLSLMIENNPSQVRALLGESDGRVTLNIVETQ